MHVVKSKARHLAWRGDDEHKNLHYFVPYANRLGRTSSGRSVMRDIDHQEPTTAPVQNNEKAPRRPHPRPVGEAIPEEYHSESCVTRDIGSNAHPIRASTVPVSYSPVEPHHNGKQSCGTSDTLCPPESDSSQESKIMAQTQSTPPKRRFPWLHKKSQADTAGDGTPLARKLSKKKTFPKKIPLQDQLRAIFWSWPNILLVCVPSGIALNYAKANPLAIFIVNFLAIVPLAGTLSFATEEIALRVGETLGGLLNASFGNATELIVSILALVKGEITIVQTSLIGSMLSNLLLVLGMCFVAGGYNRVEQNFNMTVAQTACSLLILAVGSLVIPTVFQQWSSADNEATEAKIPALSRGTAIILLFVYAFYLFFQLKTHTSTYNAPSVKVEKTSLIRKEPNDVSRGIAAVGASNAANAGRNATMSDLEANRKKSDDDKEEEQEQPSISATAAIVTLVISTAFIGLCSEFVVSSIDYVASHNGVPLEFIGLILLPIVGNAAEHATAVVVAIKDKMDLSIGVAVGSSLQIALLVIPLAVIIGWIVGPVESGTLREGVMTLNFDGFVIAVLFIAVLLVNYLIQDGKSHWLEGVMLMTTYIIIAVAAWFYPDPPGLSEG